MQLRHNEPARAAAHVLFLLHLPGLSRRGNDHHNLVVTVLRQVFAQVQVAELPAATVAWVAQCSTQDLSTDLVGDDGQFFGVGGV